MTRGVQVPPPTPCGVPRHRNLPNPQFQGYPNVGVGGWGLTSASCVSSVPLDVSR